MTFFEQFDNEWGKRLRYRRDSFRIAFDYLAKKKPTGHLIVETGCARQPDNWEGDGQSTYLFDRFANAYEGEVVSVDIDPTACAYAKSLIGPRCQVFTEDSLPFLRRLSRQLLNVGRSIDLLYLDSFDWEKDNPTPSAVHHLKELCAISPALSPGTLVIVDDSFRSMRGIRMTQGNYTILYDLGIEGKAKYVAQYFEDIGVPMAFEGYQCGWIMPE